MVPGSKNLHQRPVAFPDSRSEQAGKPFSLEMASFYSCCFFIVPLLLSTVFSRAMADGGQPMTSAMTASQAKMGSDSSASEARWFSDERSLYSVGTRCSKACKALRKDLSKDEVFLPGDNEYEKESSAYWSNLQAEQSPYCYVTPSSARQVARSVLIAERTNCSFAVKSGGHAAFAGASNTDHGFTIDLKNLREITVSKDRRTTRVGPGNHWVDVYKALSPMGLSVIGGRVSAIGVGGLTLGGGISFFSGRHGFACDNVRNYEVVLGGGRILNVNYSSYPDLYFALRGGGNNFGIVTRFDLASFEQGKMWGGAATYLGAQNATIFKALKNFANKATEDPDGHTFVAFAYAQGQFFGSNAYDYAKPVVNPPIFHEFTAIANLSSTMRIRALPNITQELEESNPSGLRETYTTATFKMDTGLMKDILAIFAERVLQLAKVEKYLPAIVYQPITKPTIKEFRKNGGNALGIEEADGPLLLLNIAVMWASAKDDSRVISNTQSILRRSIELAKQRQLHHRYLYQNYASLNQDVFQSYGAMNYERLVEISEEYDPRRTFQRLQPGYFKLTRPNGGSING